MEAPPPISPPPAAAPDSNEKLLAIFCHLSLFIGVGIILPLIIYLLKKDQAGPVGAHAREALNFHISLLIYSLCVLALCLIVIGFPLLIILSVIALVFPIVAAVKASEGQLYRYPLCIRLVN